MWVTQGVREHPIREEKEHARETAFPKLIKDFWKLIKMPTHKLKREENVIRLIRAKTTKMKPNEKILKATS